ILQDVSNRAIERARHHLVIHSGAVSWHGRAVMLPAPPDSGKTTLSAALTRAGFSYLTDEAALIDPTTGAIHPFPRALCMERPTLRAMPELIETLPPECGDLSREHYHVRPDDLREGAV